MVYKNIGLHTSEQHGPTQLEIWSNTIPFSWYNAPLTFIHQSEIVGQYAPKINASSAHSVQFHALQPKVTASEPTILIFHTEKFDEDCKSALVSSTLFTIEYRILINLSAIDDMEHHGNKHI